MYYKNEKIKNIIEKKMDNEIKIKHKLVSPNEDRWKNSKEKKNELKENVEKINTLPKMK